MKKADILVVTVTLGNRESLTKTVNSVKEIGGDRIFHVIVTPQARTVKLKEEFPDVTIIEEPINCKSFYSALNYGIKKYAKNFKYLSFINDDDYWLPHYSQLIKSLDDNLNIDVVYGKVKFIDCNDLKIGVQTCSNRYKAFGALLRKNIVLFTQQATLMRSELFFKTDGFDESLKLIADSIFWLESINNKAQLRYINLFCATYTIQKGQLTSNKDLLNNENKIIFKKVRNINKLYVYFEYFLFRITNIKIYLIRFLNHGTFSIKGRG